MKKTTRDGIADLSMQLCRLADAATAQAKEHALKALDGDADARAMALQYRAESHAYMIACKNVDQLRLSVERGDYA